MKSTSIFTQTKKSKIGFRSLKASLVLTLWLTQSLPVVGQNGSVESAIGAFRETNRNVSMFSIYGSGTSRTLIEGEGRATAVKLGYTGRLSELKDEESLLVKDQLQGKSSMREDSITLSVDQGIRVGTTLSLFTGGSSSPVAKSRWSGVRFGEWWLEETLQTTIEIRSADTDSDPVDFTDVDNYRIRTPETTNSSGVTFGVLNFATPNTILKGSLAKSWRSDRPSATAVTGEVRQFIDSADGAMHAAFGYYQNKGSISTETTYGEIVSKSARFEWHQNLKDAHIVAFGYRYYLEEEDPRAEGFPTKSIGTDSIFGSWRYRFGEGPRAVEKDEIYLFTGQSTSNADSATIYAGIGGKKGF